jgi:hypothetical protein
MTGQDAYIDELSRLTAALCDGAIDGADFARLERLLQTNPAARRWYIAYMDLHGELCWDHGRRAESREWIVESECGTRVASGEWGMASEGISDQWPVASGQRVESRESRVESETIVASGEWRVASEIQRPKTQDLRPEFPNLQTPTLHSPLSTLHYWAFSYSVATVFLAFVMLGAWSYTITHPDPESLSVKNRRSATSFGNDANKTPEFTFVGHVSGMVDCQWAEDATATSPGAAVALNRRYALKSGLMEITYDSRAKVILQGPCEYTVESPRGGYLKVGKLTAKVESRESRVESAKPQAAAPESLNPRIPNPKSPTPHASRPTPLFSVRTPTATVEDLGTEFGVEVSATGETASHVFQGKVVMKVAGDVGRWTGDETANTESPNPRTPNPEIILSAGQSAAVANGKIVHCAANPAAYVRVGQLTQLAEEKRLAPLRCWEKFSNELRKRPDLLAYYDFQPDAADRTILRNRAATGSAYDGRIEGAQWAAGRFAGKSALQFGRGGVRVNIPVECPQLTLAAWVNLDSLPMPPDALQYGDGYGGLLMSDGWNRVSSGGADFTGRIHWQIAFDGRMGFTLDDWDGVHCQPVFDNANGQGYWHHLAVVYIHGPEASRAALYFDGQHVGGDDMAAAAHPTMTAKFGSAMIGAWWDSRDADRTSASRSLSGRIDELMIFRAALDGKEIEKMFKACP